MNDLKDLAKAYLKLANANEELITGKQDFVTKARKVVTEGKLLKFLTIFHRETGVRFTSLEFLDDLAGIENSIIEIEDSSPSGSQDFDGNVAESSEDGFTSKIRDAEVFRLILALIIASETEGIASMNASRRNSSAELSLHAEQLEFFRQNLLLLFNQVLGGNPDAHKRAFEYIAEEGIEVNTKLLDWLWGKNAFSAEDTHVPEGVTLQ